MSDWQCALKPSFLPRGATGGAAWLLGTGFAAAPARPFRGHPSSVMRVSGMMLIGVVLAGMIGLERVGAGRTMPQPSSREEGGPTAMMQAYAKMQMSMKKGCATAVKTLKSNPALAHRAFSLRGGHISAHRLSLRPSSDAKRAQMKRSGRAEAKTAGPPGSARPMAARCCTRRRKTAATK